MSTITGVCQHPLYCEQSVRQIKYNDPDLKRCKNNCVHTAVLSASWLWHKCW